MEDDLQIGVSKIGQPDTAPPEPAQSPAPRAQLVDPGPQETGGDDTEPGATQADIAKHAYDLARRAEEDQNKAREQYKGMQEEIRSLYREEQANAGTPFPQAQPYPEEPKYAYRPLALLHLMMALPQAVFGGEKYNRGGAISGLNAAIQEFKNSGSNGARLALYREQVNIIHQQNEDRLKQYQDIMADKRADIHTKMEAITTLAGLYKDTATVNAAATDNWEHFADYLAKVEKSLQDNETNVYSTMDKLHKLFGADTEDDRAWVSEGAEKYPELYDGLYSPDNPRAYGKARHELEKRMPFWKWRKENFSWLHPQTEEKREELEELEKSKGGKPPPDTPTDATREAIEKMRPDLLFGTPKPGEQKPKEPKSKREALGYDPRHPFDKPKPTPTSDE